jgi:hypothetical protein
VGYIFSYIRPKYENLNNERMIEVNLYSIPAGDNTARVGKCLARNRFDREAMGVSVPEFVKGFLKDNLDKFETGIANPELNSLINSDGVLSRKDLACINYYLVRSGFMFQVQNVADDEDNATGVPSGDVIEWNVIDNNFIQNDYPTATKIIPSVDQDIPSILHQIVEQSGLFDNDKFAGIKNPFTDLFTNIDRIKSVSGSINATLVSRVYETLDQVGFSVFCATSED